MERMEKVSMRATETKARLMESPAPGRGWLPPVTALYLGKKHTDFKVTTVSRDFRPFYVLNTLPGPQMNRRKRRFYFIFTKIAKFENRVLVQSKATLLYQVDYAHSVSAQSTNTQTTLTPCQRRECSIIKMFCFPPISRI